MKARFHFARLHVRPLAWVLSAAALLLAGAILAAEGQRPMSPKEQSERRAPPLKKSKSPEPLGASVAKGQTEPARGELNRLRLENEQLKLENQQLIEEIRQRLKENAQFRERLTEHSELVEELKVLRTQHEELREDIRKVLAAEAGKRSADTPAGRPAVAPGREAATLPKPTAGTASAKPAVSAAPAPASLTVAAGSHWLTTSTGKRHNNQCPFFKASAGRPCTPTEGKACRNCGG
jgi:hypothetical protein